MHKPFLSPINDAVFKMIFGDSRDIEHLTNFLKSALTIPPEDYEEVFLPDPHLTRDGWDDKLGILDVKLRTRSGKLIDIEIQLVDQPDLRERIVFYLAKMVTEQIGEGDPYRKIQRSICILITDFTLIHENASYHNRYRLHDAHSGSEFSDLLEVNTLELPKLPRDADGSTLWDWLEFLKAESKEELDMLAEKNPQVKKAVAKLMTLSEDERARMLADSRNKMRWDIESRERAAEEKGREEERLALVRNALKRGLSVEDIAAVTGLALEQIQALMLH
jgi:predicted transposase/invertase (TIGR01784 family)